MSPTSRQKHVKINEHGNTRRKTNKKQPFRPFDRSSRTEGHIRRHLGLKIDLTTWMTMNDNRGWPEPVRRTNDSYIHEPMFEMPSQTLHGGKIAVYGYHTTIPILINCNLALHSTSAWFWPRGQKVGTVLSERNIIESTTIFANVWIR